MPLQSGVGTPIEPIPVPVAEPFGTIRATWTDPLGVVWLLTDTSDDVGYFTTEDISGWGATSYELVTDPLSRGGESMRFIRAEPARIVWPLHIWGDSHMQFVQRHRALRRAFTMTAHRKTPGLLSIYRPDGTGRAIEAYYEDGFAGQGGGEDWRYANPVLTLYCPDGHWRDIEPRSVVRQYGTSVPYLNPYPSVSSAKLLGATIIDNPGDVLAWPVWNITGPLSQMVATNGSSGDAFTLTYSLLAGETIDITTQRPTVRDAGGANLASALNWPSAVLWPLLPGLNEVTFTATGAAVGTQVALEYYPRYEGA